MAVRGRLDVVSVRCMHMSLIPRKPPALMSASDYNFARETLLKRSGRNELAPSEGGFWALLASSGSPYSWTEQVDMYGTWHSTARTGTSSAYECNGSPGLAGKRAYLLAGPSGNWSFQYVRKGGSGTDITLPGDCPCTTIPSVLSLDVSGCSSGVFVSDTLSYQLTPSGLLPLNLGTHCFLSNSLHTDSDTGDLFRYYFSCQSNYFSLTRVYESSLYGSPYRDILLFNWSLPWFTNTCTPFYLHAGVIYPGGDPACVLQVHG